MAVDRDVLFLYCLPVFFPLIDVNVISHQHLDVNSLNMAQSVARAQQ